METLFVLFIKATILLAAALLLVRALAKANPRWRMLACEITAGSILLLPLVSLFPLAISIPFGTAGPESPSVLAPPAEPVAVAPSSAEGSFPEAGMFPLEQESNQPATRSSQAPDSQNTNLTKLALFGFYALVVSALAFRYFRSARRMKDSIAQLPEADRANLARLEILAREVGLKYTPQLRVADLGTSPFCCGWRRSTIVVPASLCAPPQSDALDLVLRHELHHLANRDLLRSAFMYAAAAVLWFHPLMWVLRRCHSTATEELGDRAAAGGESGRTRYRSMLANLALDLRGAGSLPPVALGLFRTPQIVVRLRRLGFAAPHKSLSIAAQLTALVAIAAPVLMTVSALQLSAIAAPKDTAAKSNPLFEALPKKDRKKAREMTAVGAKALLAMQREDGSFAGMKDDARSQDTGATGLAGAALLSYSRASGNPEAKDAALRCIDYILARQREDGYFTQSKESTSGSIYHHAIAIWFLARAIDHTDEGRQRKIRESLPRAVTILEKGQEVRKAEAAQGGWRYTPDSKDSDLSCTTWVLCALHAAKEAGVEVEEATVTNGYKYVRKLQSDDGGFAYTASANGMLSNVPRTGMGLYLLHLHGGGKTDAASKAAKFFNSKYREPQKFYARYGLLWGSMAMSRHGGKIAEDYAKWLVKHCAESQQENGSWDSSFGEALGSAFVLLALNPE